MILLVTSSNRGIDTAQILESALSETVQLADSVRKAAAMARNCDYTAIVLDDPMVEIEPDALDTLLNCAGMAVPVYVNMGITSAERMIREVKSAMRRHEESKLIAMRAAESLLRSEIKDAITGILLTTELAMRSGELPTEAEERLRTVCSLATQVRTRLQSVQ